MSNRIAKSPCYDGRRQTGQSRDWAYVNEVELRRPTNSGFRAEIRIFYEIVSRLPIGSRDSFYFHVGEPETPVHVRGDNTASDAELVRQAGNGRPDAYGELARRWSPRVMAVCHARVRCQTSAADLAQETLLRGFRDLVTLNADFRRPEIDPHFEAEIGEIRAFLRGQCVMISHSEGSFSVGQT
jgi:hypothetical protein